MNAVMHAFPGMRQSLGAISPVAAPTLSPMPELEVFDSARTKELSSAINEVIAKSQKILDLLQSDRDAVRRIGIESLSVEILAVVEGDKFRRIADAVES